MQVAPLILLRAIGKAGKIFTYARGNAAGYTEAAEYARGVGVPEAQLDWPA